MKNVMYSTQFKLINTFEKNYISISHNDYYVMYTYETDKGKAFLFSICVFDNSVKTNKYLNSLINEYPNLIDYIKFLEKQFDIVISKKQEVPEFHKDILKWRY